MPIQLEVVIDTAPARESIAGVSNLLNLLATRAGNRRFSLVVISEYMSEIET